MISIRTVFFALLAASATNALPINWEEFLDMQARDGGLSCYPLTLDQVKTIPGWSKIQDYANKNFGTGGVNIVTNPSDFPDRPANACVNVATVNVVWAGKPTCTTTKDSVKGKVTGTTQTVSLSEQVGSQSSATWTVTQTTSLTNSVSFNVGIDIPDLLNAGATMETSATITNDRSKGFTTTSNNMKTTTLQFANAPGQSCDMGLQTQTCTATAQGQVPVMASGYVWFNYDDSRVAPSDPKGGSHFKYSVHIDSVLDAADRTTYISFQGPVNSVSKAQYTTACTGGAAPPAAAKAVVKKAVAKKAPAKPAPPKKA